MDKSVRRRSFAADRGPAAPTYTNAGFAAHCCDEAVTLHRSGSLYTKSQLLRSIEQNLVDRVARFGFSKTCASAVIPDLAC